MHASDFADNTKDRVTQSLCSKGEINYHLREMLQLWPTVRHTEEIRKDGFQRKFFFLLKIGLKLDLTSLLISKRLLTSGSKPNTISPFESDKIPAEVNSYKLSVTVVQL